MFLKLETFFNNWLNDKQMIDEIVALIYITIFLQFLHKMELLNRQICLAKFKHDSSERFKRMRNINLEES